MDTTVTVAEAAVHLKPRWNRLDAAQGVVDFELARQRAISQRELAQAADVPRSTLQGWVARKDRLTALSTRTAFFESPDGQAFLHELHVAAHLTIKQEGAGGIRVVKRLFERAGLAPYIGLSYGAQCAAAEALEKNILAYGAEQRELLAQMPHIFITLVEDETFFGKIICLVAMDPVSGFIFVERYVSARDSDTWTAEVKAALEGLPITVIQAVSDQAKGLLKHAKEGLLAHHSPDLFHPLHDVYKAIGPTLSARLRQAEKAYEVAIAAAKAEQAEKQEYLAGVMDRGPGRPPNFAARIDMTASAEAVAKETLDAVLAVKASLSGAVNAVSDAYHPVDLATGKVQSVAEVAQRFEQSFAVLADIADDLDISERGQDLLAKARRMIEPMTETIRFFARSVIGLLKEANLSSDLISFLIKCLIPLVYLQMAEKKSKGARRQLIRATIAKLTVLSQAAGSPLIDASDDTRAMLFLLARHCAQLFQRSSSCVEGRNGLLSLQQHAGRRLPSGRLAVLQILHNFDIQRSDGTTAAQRLSGTKPPDLFAWLLKRQPMPPRPMLSSVERNAKAAA